MRSHSPHILIVVCSSLLSINTQCAATELAQLNNQLNLLANSIVEINPNDIIERVTSQDFPKAIREHVIEKFTLLGTTAPAPSLRATHRIDVTTMEKLKKQIGMKRLRVVAVSNMGDIFFIGQAGEWSPHKLFVIRRGKGASNIEQISPTEGWFVAGNQYDWNMSLNYMSRSCGYIPVVRLDETKTIELGSFDIMSGHITNLGPMFAPGKSFMIYVQKTDRAINPHILALNAQAAVVQVKSGDDEEEESNILLYKMPNREEVIDVQRYNFNAALDKQNRVLWDKHWDNLQFFDAKHPKDIIKLPPVHGGINTFFAVHREGALVTCINATVLKQWLCTKDTYRELFTYPWWDKLGFQIDSNNIVAIATFAYGETKSLRLNQGPRVIVLATGEILQDTIPGIISSMMASPNGQWIAAEEIGEIGQDGASINLWEVRGTNLGPLCTTADRMNLADLHEHYKVGMERNKKYNKNYVVRLNPQQWAKFQKLLKRPECEVPDDWARIFRPMK